jgi:hypothetical protein
MAGLGGSPGFLPLSDEIITLQKLNWGTPEESARLARGIEERFLHGASRLVRRSEREDKASARSGRNDTLWVEGG